MKFKVGDKVKVKDNSKIDDGAYAGQHGVVTEAFAGRLPYPYNVLLEGGTDELVFHANELEKVED